MKYSVLILALVLASCNWAKQKTKETVNKTGEVVAKAGSEFVDGAKKGVEKTFENEVRFSDKLKDVGLHSGKIIINSADGGSDNVLTMYLIYDKDLDQQVTVKVLTDKGDEYGRAIQRITGSKGQAGYTDFVFDKRMNIDGRGVIVVE